MCGGRVRGAKALIRVTLKNLQKTGRVECLGRGRFGRMEEGAPRSA